MQLHYFRTSSSKPLRRAIAPKTYPKITKIEIQKVQKSMSGEKCRATASRVEKRPLEARPGGLLLEAKLAPSWARWRPRWASKRQIMAHSWNLKIDVDLDFPWNRIFSKFGWFEVLKMKAFRGQKSQYLRTMLEMREELRTIIFLIYVQ